MDQGDYNLESVSNRMFDLMQVLRYDREFGFKNFDWIDRMNISRERSALQSFKNYLFREITHDQVNWFTVPKPLDAKIAMLIKKITSENWQHKPSKNESE